MLVAVLLSLGLQGPPSIDDFKFLAGVWKSENSEGKLELNWSKPSGGTMVGVGKQWNLQDTKAVEFLFIEPREGKFILWLQTTTPKQGPPKPIQFNVAEVVKDPPMVRFENPHQQFPSKITFTKATTGGIGMVLEGQKDGKPLKVERNYTASGNESDH